MPDSGEETLLFVTALNCLKVASIIFFALYDNLICVTIENKEKATPQSMLRRVAPRSSFLLAASPSFQISVRHGGGGPTQHDHSHIFSRSLTQEESIALEDQKKRTVSSVVPGKLFMRHWIAAEQSTVSIVNRALSLAVTLGIFVWASGYAGLGVNGLNAWHVVLMTFLANWIVLHTHMLWIAPVLLGAATAQILFN